MILPEWRSRLAAQMWREVEAMGFDSGWTVDHLSWRSLSDGPWYATFPFLTVAATATSRIRLGTLVTSPNFRHPVLTAKDAMTLDEVSDGRFELGVGAGATGAGDAQVVDDRVLDPGSRARRFEEFVRLTDRLLRERVVTARGEFYLADQARTIPGCVQQPRLPLIVAATGPRGLRFAAEVGDAWSTCGPADVAQPCPPERLMAAVRDQSRVLDEACASTGRDPGSIRRVVVTTEKTNDMTRSPQRFLDEAAQLAELGVDEIVVQWPRAEGIFAGAADSLTRIAGDVLDRVQSLSAVSSWRASTPAAR